MSWHRNGKTLKEEKKQSPAEMGICLQCCFHNSVERGKVFIWQMIGQPTIHMEEDNVGYLSNFISKTTL